ncbi:MAG: helix-turn-helix domain-containing protein [Myxococcota bacterium]
MTVADGVHKSVGEVALLLGVSEKTVRRYLKAGEFPNAYRLGQGMQGGWRIPPADVSAWLNNRRCHS